ncbi:hypothetical protein [Sulfurimonas sp.]
MTVEELIEMLQKRNPKAIVSVFDPLMGEEFMPVKSMTYNDDEVKLYTDDN